MYIFAPQLSWFEPSWKIGTMQPPPHPLGQGRRMKGKTDWVKIRGVYRNNTKREETIEITMTKQVIFKALLSATSLAQAEPKAVQNSCPQLALSFSLSQYIYNIIIIYNIM